MLNRTQYADVAAAVVLPCLNNRFMLKVVLDFRDLQTKI